MPPSGLGSSIVRISGDLWRRADPDGRKTEGFGFGLGVGLLLGYLGGKVVEPCVIASWTRACRSVRQWCRVTRLEMAIWRSQRWWFLSRRQSRTERDATRGERASLSESAESRLSSPQSQNSFFEAARRSVEWCLAVENGVALRFDALRESLDAGDLVVFSYSSALDAYEVARSPTIAPRKVDDEASRGKRPAQGRVVGDLARAIAREVARTDEAFEAIVATFVDAEQATRYEVALRSLSRRPVSVQTHVAATEASYAGPRAPVSDGGRRGPTRL